MNANLSGNIEGVLSRSEMKQIKAGDGACLICSTGDWVYEFDYSTHATPETPVPQSYPQSDPTEFCQHELYGVGHDENYIEGTWGLCP